MPELRRRMATVVALAATVAAVGGCADGVRQGGPLRGLPEDEGVGLVVHDADRFPTWHFGSFVVCLEEDGPVRLDGVDAATVGGVKIVSVGAKETSKDMVGGMPGPMPDQYVPVSGFRVRDSCAAGRGVELVLELAVPASGSSAVDGFTIRYSQGSDAYEVGYAAQIVLCRGQDTSADEKVLADCADGTAQ